MMTPQIVCGGPGCKIELEYRVRGTRLEHYPTYNENFYTIR